MNVNKEHRGRLERNMFIFVHTIIKEQKWRKEHVFIGETYRTKRGKRGIVIQDLKKGIVI